MSLCLSLQYGQTVLIQASIYGCTNVIQLLLAAGANIDAVNDVSYKMKC